METFADQIKRLRKEIDATLPGSREKALVLTKLDEARLWMSELLSPKQAD